MEDITLNTQIGVVQGVAEANQLAIKRTVQIFAALYVQEEPLLFVIKREIPVKAEIHEQPIASCAAGRPADALLSRAGRVLVPETQLIQEPFRIVEFCASFNDSLLPPGLCQMKVGCLYSRGQEKCNQKAFGWHRQIVFMHFKNPSTIYGLS